MTPHECWNVCHWKTTGDQASEAQLSLPTYTHRKSEKHPSDCGHPAFEKWQGLLPTFQRKVARFAEEALRLALFDLVIYKKKTRMSTRGHITITNERKKDTSTNMPTENYQNYYGVKMYSLLSLIRAKITVFIQSGNYVGNITACHRPAPSISWEIGISAK